MNWLIDVVMKLERGLAINTVTYKLLKIIGYNTSMTIMEKRDKMRD